MSLTAFTGLQLHTQPCQLLLLEVNDADQWQEWEGQLLHLPNLPLMLNHACLAWQQSLWSIFHSNQL